MAYPPRQIAKWSTYTAIVEVYNPTWWERLVTLGQIALEQSATLAITLVTLLYASLVRSWVWFWFVVPAFHFPVLNTLQMVGLTFILQAMTYRTPMADESLKRESRTVHDTWRGFLSHYANSLFSWSLIWAVAWVAFHLTGAK